MLEDALICQSAWEPSLVYRLPVLQRLVLIRLRFSEAELVAATAKLMQGPCSVG